jgi:hypothetical protein
MTIPLIFAMEQINYTAKTKWRNFETNISQKRNRGLSSNLNIHAPVSDLYIPMIGLLAGENM